MIQGETGTGKELIARAIRAASPRIDRPFVPVACAALAENLLESEPIGHLKGAFTGAMTDKRGLFATAHGGTCFRDEIGRDQPVRPSEASASAPGARSEAHGRDRQRQGGRPGHRGDQQRPGSVGRPASLERISSAARAS